MNRYARISLALVTFTVLLAGSSRAMSPEGEQNIQVYEKNSPSVVNITNTAIAYDFFYNPIAETGSGSGAIIDTEGHILTNYHVVEGAQKLEVTLYDGSKYEASAVGGDAGNDLAVIKIDAPKSKLKPIVYGDSSAL